MAYTTPANIRELRDQATLISMCWKDNQSAMKNKTRPANPESEPSNPIKLETLTIEFDNANIIVRLLQKRLLLVLVGGVPPNRRKDFKATPEVTGEPRYPSIELVQEAIQERASTSAPESSAQDFRTATRSSLPNDMPLPEMSEKQKDIKLGALHIQRKKADALAEYIKAEFDAAEFVMPDDASNPFG